ncbi:MAG: phosphoribosylformylglycinamidine synthase subunit PurS [Deltaproteobacteria bacterium]|nr:phosphoribosylformylglycinamidine synthase subunit PurS [Deltaproteobacteria bacterium]
MRARVLVRLRSGVLDPKGEAVKTALHSLGFDEVKGVRIGKFIELEVKASDEEAAKKRIHQMADQLLANPVMETFVIESGESS